MFETQFLTSLIWAKCVFCYQKRTQKETNTIRRNSSVKNTWYKNYLSFRWDASSWDHLTARSGVLQMLMFELRHSLFFSIPVQFSDSLVTHSCCCFVSFVSCCGRGAVSGNYWSVSRLVVNMHEAFQPQWEVIKAERCSRLSSIHTTFPLTSSQPNRFQLQEDGSCFHESATRSTQVTLR